jgi:hypothetical protein
VSEPGPGQDWLRGSGESQATRQGVPAAILSDLLHRALESRPRWHGRQQDRNCCSGRELRLDPVSPYIPLNEKGFHLSRIGISAALCVA